MSRTNRMLAILVLLVGWGAGGLTPTIASADLDRFALNGTFTAISDGVFAKTNERRERQATVVSTWTITTSCRTAIDCSGRMTSDQGWTADVTYTEPLWYVTRTLPDWLKCPDGTAVPGQQTFKFFEDQFDKPNLRGWDNTLAVSGACGVNKVLNIEMPFKLIPIG
ncbi:Rv2253/PknI dimerization domain-containing protein [Mycolicibacterium sp. XJ1819]